MANGNKIDTKIDGYDDDDDGCDDGALFDKLLGWKFNFVQQFLSLRVVFLAVAQCSGEKSH